MTLDALTVARAALMEVGVDLVLVDTAEDGRLQCWPGNPPALRAMLLGTMAAHGGDYLVRCDCCNWRAEIRPPCTPVRDALRGLTCGRWA